MALISIRGLTKYYRMGDSVVHALDHVNLEIERGEFVAITGASGSGKSTMMHLVGCLDRPTAGSYVLNGQDVSNFSDRQLAEVRNKEIGFVFQTFNLINRTSAMDNVGVPLFYARKTRIGDGAKRALERVGLAHRGHHRPSELSGGERQRVAIARAIVNDPVLLLADEPTGNLDSRTGEQIMQVFHDLNAQGVTIVLVTHEADVAVQARRIVHMKDGKIVSDRSVSEEERRATRELHESQNSAIATASARKQGDDDNGDGPGGGAGSSSMAAGSPRLARGVNSSLVCAMAAPLIFLIAYGSSLAMGTVKFDANKPPPNGVMIRGAAVMLAIILSLVLAVIAIFKGRGALRRMYNEPGAWHGKGRAKTAMVLGWLVVAAPVLMVLRRFVG